MHLEVMTTEAAADRPLALQIIIGYKVIKAVAVLAMALTLTLASGYAFEQARHWTRNMLEHGGLLHQAALWMQNHLTIGTVKTVRLLAWLDGAMTALEAGLLISGKSWGEWLVVAGLAALLPFEVRAAIVHGHLAHYVVLTANTAIVLYVVHRQLERHRLHAQRHA